jgi:hypothetical protein
MSGLEDIPIDPALLEEERDGSDNESDDALADVADDSSGFDDDSDDAYIEEDDEGPVELPVVRPSHVRDDDAVFR